ncbi:MAG: chorismate mutase [Acidobacteria bacterium]|nr:chorismate mutase [Acidobacteriota bacterium]
MPDPSREIQRRRRLIDRIDRELLRLLSARAQHAVALARVKLTLGQPIYDPERERQVLEAVLRANRGPLADDAVLRLFERIVDESRRLERSRGERHEEEPT